MVHSIRKGKKLDSKTFFPRQYHGRCQRRSKGSCSLCFCPCPLVIGYPQENFSWWRRALC